MSEQRNHIVFAAQQRVPAPEGQPTQALLSYNLGRNWQYGTIAVPVDSNNCQHERSEHIKLGDVELVEKTEANTFGILIPLMGKCSGCISQTCAMQQIMRQGEQQDF